MAKIRKEEIAEKDLFGDIGKSAVEAKEKVAILETSLEMVVKIAKDIKGKLSLTNTKDTAGIKEINKLTKQANTLSTQRTRIQEKLTVAQSDQGKKNEVLNQKLKQQNKLNREAAKETLGLVSAIDKERKKLNELIKARENLVIENKKDRKASKELERQIKRTSAAIDKAEKRTKKFKRGFRGLRNSVNETGKSVRRLSRGFLAFAGITSFARVLTNSFDKVVKFQKANADLAAVLGKTRKEIGNLTSDAKRLGSTTKFTASQVTGLQKEFAKLGFTTTEILGATEATLNLATAASVDLPRAAEVVGNTLRAFQLDTNQTTRVVDLMTLSFNSSALDMEKFSTAMAAVAPVAATVGISIERTTAMLGTLANNGIDASTAGTGLRNILLDLSKTGLTFNEAMEKVNKSSNKAKTAFDLFGKRGATVATIIATNTDNINELNEALENAGGTAEEVANEQMNTLSGQMSQLASAWEGFIFSLESGDGVISNVVGNAISIFTDFLGVLTDLNTTGVDKLREAISGVEKSTAEFAQVAGKVSGQTFDQITKSVEELNKELELTRDGTQGIFSDTQFGRIETYNQKIIDLKNQGLTDLEVKLALIEDQQKGTFRFLADESLSTKNLTELNKELAKNTQITEESLKNIEASRPETQFRLPFIMEDDEADQRIADSQKKFDDQINSNQKRLESFASDVALIASATEARAQQTSESIKGATTAELDALLAKTRDENLINLIQLEKIARTTDLVTKSNRKATGRVKKLTKAQKALIDKYAESIQLTRDHTFANLALAKSFFESEKASRKQAATIEKINQEEFRQSIERAKILAEEEKARQIALGLDNQDVNVDKLETLLDQEFDLRKNALELTAEAQLASDKLTAEERELIALQLAGELEQLERDRAQATIDANDEVIDAQIEGANKANEEAQKAEEERLESEKENAEVRKSFVSAFTTFFISESDKRITKIDEEIAAATRQADVLAGLAKSGNITAKESLAEQDRIIAEANLRKEREEKRKQRILWVSSVLQAYNSELAAGTPTGEAFTKAITSTVVLEQFISSLPAFMDGIEDTGTHGQGVDGQGGFHAILHPNERVMTSDQNSKMSGYSNEEVSTIIENHRLGNYVSDYPLIEAKNGGAQISEELKDEMIAVRKAIQEKPELSIGQVTQGAMMIRETQKRGNRVTTSSFKVK